MARTANVDAPANNDGKPKNLSLSGSNVTPEFYNAATSWLKNYNSDKAEQDEWNKSDLVKASVADYIGYTGATSTVPTGGGAGAAMRVRAQKATLVDQLKAKLLAGGDLNLDDIKNMILNS